MWQRSKLVKLNIDFLQIYERLPIALAIVGRDGRLLAVNELHAQLGERPTKELLGVRVSDLHEQGGRNVERDFRYFDAGKAVPNHELEIHGRHYMVSVSPVYDRKGAVTAISVAHFDITNKKAIERKIERMNRKLKELSTRDHLTKLYNRRSFDDMLRKEIVSATRKGKRFSLMIFDVDHFKLYNDHYGHQAGDKCLTTIASCAKRALRPYDAIVCRYGGEEFVAILKGAGLEEAVTAAQHIRDRVRARRIEHAGTPAGIVTTSCGVCCNDQLSRQPVQTSDLIRAADRALYDAKSQGRDIVCAFNPLPSMAKQLSEGNDLPNHPKPLRRTMRGRP